MHFQVSDSPTLFNHSILLCSLVVHRAIASELCRIPRVIALIICIGYPRILLGRALRSRRHDCYRCTIGKELGHTGASLSLHWVRTCDHGYGPRSTRGGICFFVMGFFTFFFSGSLPAFGVWILVDHSKVIWSERMIFPQLRAHLLEFYVWLFCYFAIACFVFCSLLLCICF